MNPSPQKLTHSHIEPAVNLLDTELGEGFISSENLSSYLKHPQKTILGFMQDGLVIAVITGEVLLTQEEFISVAPTDMKDSFSEALQFMEPAPIAPIGLIKSVAVHKRFRGQGFAQSLVEAMLVEQRALGASQFASLGWTDEDGCHIQTIFERNNFRTVCDIPDFWRKDSIESNYSCPSCGLPCRCTARIFFSNGR